MSDFEDLIKRSVEGSGGTIDANVEITPPEIEPEEGEIVKTPEPIIKTPEVNFDLGVFNKKFSKEFTSEEDLVSAIEKSLKYDEVNSQYESLNTKYSEIEEVAKKGTDPLKWFANTDEYIRQQFLLKKGDQYTPEALNVLTKITPSSIEKMNALEVLQTNLLIDGEIEGGKEAVDELLMDKYGIDTVNWDELDVKTRNQIKLDSKQAKQNLKSVFDGIELPHTVDFEKSRQQLKEVWQTPLQEIVKGIDKIRLTDSIDFVVSDDMKVGLMEEAMNDVLHDQKTPSVETGSQIAAIYRSKILERNMDKVVAHIASTTEARVKEQMRAKVENRESLNTDSAEGSSDEQKAALDWLKTV